MDKEEFRVKLDQINHLVEKNDYKGAMEVVDSIDWRRVKNVRTLCVVGEIYAANKRYEDSKEIFLLAYHRAPIGKNILYRLIEVSLKTGNIEEAMEYYEEYLQVAPNDSTKYILKYKIYKENNAELRDLIKILEDYKDKEFTEKWSYELAKLYYQAGEKEKCLAICNEMSLWFSDGKYVMKAMELKMKLGAMTDDEKEKFEKKFAPKLTTVEEMREIKAQEEAEQGEESDKDSETSEESVNEGTEVSEESEENNSMIGSISTKEEDVNYSESIQERISKGIRDIFNSKKRDAEEKSEVVPGEMFKDENLEKEIEEVIALEEENETEKTDRTTKKLPELKLPKGIRKNIMDEELKVPEAPKLSRVELVSPKAPEEELNFNLEDTILAAASAQGIEIPKQEMDEDDTSEKEDEFFEEVEEVEESEEEEYEEDEESEEEEYEEDEESEEEEYEENEESEEEEYEEDEEPEEEEYEEDEESEEEKLPEKKTGGMNTEMFDFQEELRMSLERDEDYIFSSATYTGSKEDREYVSDFEEEPEAIEDEETEEVQEEEAPIDPLSIIPRSNDFSEEETRLFTYFVKVPGMKEQIIDALIDAQESAADKTSRTGNIIVMGGRESGKTKLISVLIPAICKELHLEASKVAYVFADQINGKNIPQIISKLSSGFLVIEEANQLDKKTVEQLDKAMEFRTDGLTVILEDEKIGMRKFQTRYPKFVKKFTSTISIPVFTNDELVSFADVYTKENGFSIDQVGMTALYNLIGANQKADEPMSIGAVKELLDAAIKKSQSGILKLKRKRTDDEGFTILTDKDFNI